MTSTDISACWLYGLLPGLLNERPLGHVRMTGVVEGAHETSPLVMLTYTLKGKTITRKACIGAI